MSVNKIIINNDQKRKSFDLIKEIMAQYVLALEKLIEIQPANDLFNKTSKNLIIDFTENMKKLISSNQEEIEISKNVTDIIQEAMNFYWLNGKTIFNNYSEIDYVNACNLISFNSKSFVK
jgi:hypothetical protein